MSTPVLQARTFFDAMNKRDFTDLELHLAPDVAFDFPGAGAIDGSRRMLLFLKLLFREIFAACVYGSGSFGRCGAGLCCMDQ
ncbi:MAG: nuclear transport factor 2 family protein [Deltaproteobacteria bacterium]|nr:nuclear transport factor 2 family protein [Deltaproteobacteria bacterium]